MQEFLRKRQLRLLDMLIKLDKFCQNNNLEYFLIGGSTLGAVRHSGFIPWDDDIDVAMWRTDFERFEEIALHREVDGLLYEPVEGHSFPEAPIGFLYDTTDKNIPLCECPCIDVFPIDNIPNSKFMRKIQKTFSYLYHISVYRQASQNRGGYSAMITSLFIKCTPRFMFSFYTKISKKIITYWVKKDTDCVANIFGMKRFDRETMPRGNFGTPQLALFEGREFPLPQDTDKYLTRLFGDYMQLPPIEEQQPHHIKLKIEEEQV